MLKHLKPILVTFAVLLLVWFVVIIINQTAQVVEFAERIDPLFGSIVLYGLLVIYVVLAVIPFYLFLRLPKPLTMPDSENSDGYNTYIQRLTARLKRNKYIKESSYQLNSKEELLNAINYLGSKADEDIQNTAKVVFVSTAVSQSGKLDGFIVLIMLTKMIWRVAHIYNQRPVLREIIQLYANVAGTSLVAMELEEIDIGEQIEPILENVIGASLAGAIPGLQQISSFIFGCIMEGSINAYLTLRVGSITKRYCGSLVKPERKTLRRLASVEAAGQLGKIIKGSGSEVVDKIKKFYKDKFTSKKESYIDKAKSLMKRKTSVNDQS